MNWILDETIYNLKSRISALEKVINNEEVNRIYKMSKVEEIKFLKEILQEIDEMMQEEVRSEGTRLNSSHPTTSRMPSSA